jgi:hypothetical protein
MLKMGEKRRKENCSGQLRRNIYGRRWENMVLAPGLIAETPSGPQYHHISSESV